MGETFTFKTAIRFLMRQAPIELRPTTLYPIHFSHYGTAQNPFLPCRCSSIHLYRKIFFTRGSVGKPKFGRRPTVERSNQKRILTSSQERIRNTPAIDCETADPRNAVTATLSWIQRRSARLKRGLMFAFNNKRFPFRADASFSSSFTVFATPTSNSTLGLPVMASAGRKVQRITRRHTEHAAGVYRQRNVYCIQKVSHLPQKPK